MSGVSIRITIVKQKSGHNISLACPYCTKHSKTFDGLRKHLTRFHKGEIGFDEVHKQASKLYRLYKGARQ